jgi:hypothetical protein
MGLKRTLVAICDTCLARQKLNPNDSQPFLTLTDQGWTLGYTDVDVLTTCPVCSGGDENHGTILVSAFVWVFNTHANRWLCTNLDTWDGNAEDLAAEIDGYLQPRSHGSIYVGFDAGAQRIIDEDGVIS